MLCMQLAPLSKKVRFPGGGVAYIRAIEALEGLKGENEDETTGIEIV